MFGIFSDVLEAGVDMVSDVFEGEFPKKKDVVTMLDAGLTITAIAATFNVTEDIIMEVLND